MRIIILGAGITGLSAALNLLNHNHEIIILEKKSSVGGLISTFRWNNHIFDYGAFVCYPNLIYQLPHQIVNTLNCKKIDSLSSQLWHNSKIINWPMTVNEVIKEIGINKMFIGFVDFIKTLIVYRNREISTLEELIIKKMGKYFYKYSLLEEEIFKLTNRRSKELSKQFAIDHLNRLNEMSIKNYILKLFHLNNSKQDPPEYPLGGINSLPEAIEKYLLLRGVQIMKGAEVVKINNKGDWIDEVCYVKDEQIFKLKADFVISTIPITQTILLLNLNDKLNILKNNKLNYRHLLLLFLILNKAQVSEKQLTYAFETNFKFKRIVEFKNYDDRNAPKNQSGLGIEICYSDESEIVNTNKLLRDIVNNLTDMKLIDSSQIIDYKFRRSEYAYPVEELNYEKKRDKLLEMITFNNMISCGRQGIFRYSRMAYGYTMGKVIANNINLGVLDKNAYLDILFYFAYNCDIDGMKCDNENRHDKSYIDNEK